MPLYRATSGLQNVRYYFPSLDLQSSYVVRVVGVVFVLGSICICVFYFIFCGGGVKV